MPEDIAPVAANTVNTNDSGFIAYKRTKKSLVENLESAIKYIHNNPASELNEISGQHVLEYTITTLLSRLNGNYEEGVPNYFYLEFLQNDFVLLDDEYLPILEEVAEIEELSILSRIEAHSRHSTFSLEQRLDDIFRRN